MSEVGAREGWWLASDGNWYPPELHPDRRAPVTMGAFAAVGPRARFKRLRYGGTCLACKGPIAVDEEAWHDPDLKKVTCSSCRPRHARTDVAPPSRAVSARGANPVGGSSALRVSQERGAPKYAKGAVGEFLVAKRLFEDLGDEAVILNDRRVPGGAANIDHVVVASSGVWVIDAKKWRGLIEYKNVGDPFAEKRRLLVGGHDRTEEIEKIYKLVIPVAQAVGDPAVPIHPALVFVDGDWGSGATLRILSKRPYRHLGVWVTWPRALTSMIAKPGPLTLGDVRVIGERLDGLLVNR